MSGGATRTGGASRRLVVVWLLLAILAAGIVVLEMRDPGTDDHLAVKGERWLLPVEITEVGAIEIMNRGTLHRFERDAGGVWFYHGIHAETTAAHGHTTDPVAAEKIDTALVGFSRARREREFPLDVANDEFGVTRPEIFILAYGLKDPQPLVRYAVGTVAPDKVSRYVLPVGSAEVVTIADFHIDNLLNLIAAMQVRAETAGAGQTPR
jgi:hypothetical protein